MMMKETFHAIDMSNICIFMLSIDNGLMNQLNLSIIEKINKEGKAVIIIINKIDLLNEKTTKKTIEDFKKNINNSIQGMNIRLFFAISSLNENNFSDIISEAIKLYELYSSDIKTSKLNDFLQKIKSESTFPKINNRILKLKFIKQIENSPHYFMISSNFSSNEIPDSFETNIKKHIQNSFNLYNMPIRLIFKKSENPYDKKK